MLATQILIKPLITEKSHKLLAKQVYLFVVHPKADKPMVKNAFETIFGVQVASVNLTIRKRKPKAVGRFHGFKKAVKKAYITIKPGQKFDFLKDEDGAQALTAKTNQTNPVKPKWSLFNKFGFKPKVKSTDVVASKSTTTKKSLPKESK